MSGPPIELLLLKQVAGYLAMPVFLIDEDGALEYYNEPAEELLGQRYEETGQIPLDTWGKIWAPTDLEGRPLAPEELPVAMAGRERRPVQPIVEPCRSVCCICRESAAKIRGFVVSGGMNPAENLGFCRDRYFTP